jgi:hypothetical protein
MLQKKYCPKVTLLGEANVEEALVESEITIWTSF